VRAQRRDEIPRELIVERKKRGNLLPSFVDRERDFVTFTAMHACNAQGFVKVFVGRRAQCRRDTVRVDAIIGNGKKNEKKKKRNGHTRHFFKFRSIG
jgi:hypothetical protein